MTTKRPSPEAPKISISLTLSLVTLAHCKKSQFNINKSWSLYIPRWCNAVLKPQILATYGPITGRFEESLVQSGQCRLDRPDKDNGVSFPKCYNCNGYRWCSCTKEWQRKNQHSGIQVLVGDSLVSKPVTLGKTYSGVATHPNAETAETAAHLKKSTGAAPEKNVSPMRTRPHS
jgi:hypothetical protein